MIPPANLPRPLDQAVRTLNYPEIQRNLQKLSLSLEEFAWGYRHLAKGPKQGSLSGLHEQLAHLLKTRTGLPDTLASLAWASHKLGAHQVVPLLAAHLQGPTLRDQQDTSLGLTLMAAVHWPAYPLEVLLQEIEQRASQMSTRLLASSLGVLAKVGQTSDILLTEFMGRSACNSVDLSECWWAAVQTGQWQVCGSIMSKVRWREVDDKGLLILAWTAGQSLDYLDAGQAKDFFSGLISEVLVHRKIAEFSSQGLINLLRVLQKLEDLPQFELPTEILRELTQRLPSMQEPDVGLAAQAAAPLKCPNFDRTLKNLRMADYSLTTWAPCALAYPELVPEILGLIQKSPERNQTYFLMILQGATKIRLKDTQILGLIQYFRTELPQSLKNLSRLLVSLNALQLPSDPECQIQLLGPRHELSKQIVGQGAKLIPEASNRECLLFAKGLLKAQVTSTQIYRQIAAKQGIWPMADSHLRKVLFAS